MVAFSFFRAPPKRRVCSFLQALAVTGVANDTLCARVYADVRNVDVRNADVRNVDVRNADVRNVGVGNRNVDVRTYQVPWYLITRTYVRNLDVRKRRYKVCSKWVYVRNEDVRNVSVYYA